MDNTHDQDDAQVRAILHAPPDGDVGDKPLKPWEEIETGRFMPRRIRGSYRGGKLG